MSYRDFGLVIDLADAASVASIGMDVEYLSGISVQTKFGAITGTLTLEGRNHASLQWQPIEEVEFTQPAGSAGGELFDIGGLKCKWVRVAYVHEDGSGALRVAVHAKGGL